MDSREYYVLTDLLKRNVKEAIGDYYANVGNGSVPFDLSDKFLDRFTDRVIRAKADLRELFRKSSSWDEKLQAIVIERELKVDSDRDQLNRLLWDIVRAKGVVIDPNNSNASSITEFVYTLLQETVSDATMEFFNDLAPAEFGTIWREGMKKSKVVRNFLCAFGCWDDRSGSLCQKNYAQIADMLTDKIIKQKLYISINPAHFLTMSNPHDDRRGKCLVSCHSLNSEYPYKSGCVGYATDPSTFIVFTASDDDNPETLNNRKISRQLFMYRPYSGLLLQSRMYNTRGGYEDVTNSPSVKQYALIVEEEICKIEGALNTWKAQAFDVGKHSRYVEKCTWFGGYADWQYPQFGARIMRRKDSPVYDDSYEILPLKIGESGMCLCCGEDICEDIICDKCEKLGRCADCDMDLTNSGAEGFWAIDEDGESRYVCMNCLHRNYAACDRCGEYYDEEALGFIRTTDEGLYYCPSCFDHEIYDIDKCHFCKDFCLRSATTYFMLPDGFTSRACDECLEDYCQECSSCGEVIETDDSEDYACPSCGVLVNTAITSAN